MLARGPRPLQLRSGQRRYPRLVRPMIKGENGWQEVPWQTALQHAVAGLKTVMAGSGSASDIGALANPSASLEELFLLQKLVRGLGIEQRRSSPDSGQTSAMTILRRPSLDWNCPLPGSIPSKPRSSLGSNLRKEQPLLSITRKTRRDSGMVQNGARSTSWLSTRSDYDLVIFDAGRARPDGCPGTLIGIPAWPTWPYLKPQPRFGAELMRASRQI